jgi:3',5'-cyclic AMP phosphodiesterase CpdA
MGIVAKTFKPAFIVSTGDNFYPSGVRSTRDYTWITSFEEIYTAHSLHTDWYVVLGNHDYKGEPQAEIDYSEVDRRWNMPSHYYTKTVYIGGDTTQGALLIFIDTTPLLSEYYFDGDHQKVKTQDTALQRIWLEKTLSEAPKNIKWKLVFGHHPLYTGGARMKSPETTELKNLLKPIFQKYRVNAYICGHEHSLQYIKPDGFTNYFISGAGSETTPAIVHPEGGVFSKSENGFMDFTITRDQLRVHVIGYMGEDLYSCMIERE